MKQETQIPLGMFIGGYLPFSETFIYDQLTHQDRFKAEVFAYEFKPFAKQFPYDHLHVLKGLSTWYYKTLGRSSLFENAIVSKNIELIHAHFGTNGVYGSYFAKKYDLPMAVTFHGHDVPGLFPENRWTTRYFRYQTYAHKMFNTAGLYLCCSKELYEIARDRFKIPEDKLRLHYLGIDLERFAQVDRPERDVKIMTVGRFVEKKGFIYVLKALSMIKTVYPNISLTMVGEGPLREIYDQFIQENNLSKIVTFAGTMTSQELQSTMIDHDILMAPSVVASNGDRESGLIVVKEASATGMPVIGTLHGGIPEIIDHEETGFLAQERNSTELANYLSELLDSYELRKKMGTAARAKMEREYDTLVQNASLEDHFISLLK